MDVFTDPSCVAFLEKIYVSELDKLSKKVEETWEKEEEMRDAQDQVRTIIGDILDAGRHNSVVKERIRMAFELLGEAKKFGRSTLWNKTLAIV